MENNWPVSPMVDGDPTTATIMVIGMAPGREELEQGRPFVGGTGQILFSLLAEHNLSRADCYMVNVIGEWPDKKSGPSDEQLAAYHEQFVRFTDKFRGRAVLILGGDALKRYTGLSGGIESWRGYMVKPTDVGFVDVITYEEGVYKSGPRKGTLKKIKHKQSVKIQLPTNIEMLFPTLHPAGVMRSGMGNLPALAADVDRCIRFLKGDLKESRTEYKPVPELPSCTGPVAFDIETAGIGGSLDRIGIADGDKTWSSYWSASAKAATKRYLEDPTRVKIAHNISFDYPRLKNVGVDICEPIADTMLMAAMLQPDMPKGLEYVAAMYLDGERWKHLSDEKPAFYNARDTSATLELYYVLQQQLEDTGQSDLFHAIIMPGVVEFMRMSEIGLQTDHARREKWIASLKAKQDELSKKWNAKYPDVSYRSPQQLKKLLYEDLDLPFQYDKYGVITTNELALRDLAFAYPDLAETFDLLLDLRSADKDLATYASVSVGWDGRVHPSYLPAGKDDDRYDPEDGKIVGKGLAGTWRPTAKNPNIQNQTKEAKLIYVSRLPGHVFVEADYNAFEARILAALSGDSVLQTAIEEGLHQHNMDLLGVDKVRAKNAFYGWSYGAGAKTLQRTFRARGFDVSMKTCRQMLDTFDKRYNNAARWRDNQIALARTQRYVENPFGLRRYFYSNNPGTAPANTPIQSTAAIIMWKVIPELGRWARSVGGNLVAMVHDSVEFELPLGVDVTELYNIMQQPFECVAPGFSVPIEVKCGPSWGEVA